MKDYKVSAVYYSPTRTSKKGVEAIAGTLSTQFTSMDVTMINNEVGQVEYDATDVVVFGAPVYGGRLYRGSLEAFTKLKGHNTPCVVTVTYGNRHYDDALLELADLVQEQGFVPIAGAALIGEHTFGEIQMGRPNEVDVEEDKQFSNEIKHYIEEKEIDADGKMEWKTIQLPGNIPYKEGGSGGGFRPSTLDTCVDCGLCAKRCPMQAIDYADVSKINNDTCISCFRCIKSCPVQAKVCDSEAYITFAEGFTKRLAERRENEYFL